jgi:hypothetical protein
VPMGTRLLAAACALAVLALLAPPPARASCSRVVQPFRAWFEQADAIFVGTALDVFETPVAPPPESPPETKLAELGTRFRVEERFKGDLGEHVTVFADKVWRDCIVEFEVGERYVVFAFRQGANRGTGRIEKDASDAALRSNDSSPTRRVAGSGDTLAYLRHRAATGREPSLVGTVFDRSPSSIEDGSARDTTRAGVPVVVTGGGRTWTAVSGGDGAFMVDELPEGTYSIRVELPAGTRLYDRFDHAPFGFPPDEAAPDRLEIKANETAATYFTVSDAASVTGRAVTASGAPVTAYGAYLVLASALDDFDPGSGSGTLIGHLNERGAFRFDVVPPGEYVLVVNPGRRLAFDAAGPTFYHPGVTEPEKATRFAVRNGKALDLGVVKAPAVTNYRPLDVTVVDDAGRGRQVDLVLDPIAPAGAELSFATDASGRARLFLRPGVRFRLGVWAPSAGGPVGTVELGPETTLPPVRLVAPEAADGEQ